METNKLNVAELKTNAKTEEKLTTEDFKGFISGVKQAMELKIEESVVFTNANGKIQYPNFYKVIEERMTPTGRIEYWTLPLYEPITEDEINGKHLFQAKETRTEKMLKKFNLNSDKKEENYIHLFLDLETAMSYVEKQFKGYQYTRPVIYECECMTPEIIINPDNTVKCEAIKFIRPISQFVNFKNFEYIKMVLPEKKKSYGIQYDESQINGDTDYVE